MVQRVQDELLVPLDGLFQDAYRQVLPRAVGDKDVAWAVEVARVVARQVGHVGAVVDGDGVKVCAC